MFNSMQNNTQPNPADLAWLNFCNTGEIGYYMLYKNLGGKKTKKDIKLE